jgi:ribosomal protein L37AE/L43A
MDNEQTNGAAEAHKAPVETCPKCGRKLLSALSILCNWCGARIDDAEYLAKAAQERAALDKQMKDQIDRELAETERLGVLGRLHMKGKLGELRKPVLVEPSEFSDAAGR